MVLFCKPENGNINSNKNPYKSELFSVAVSR
ncbi:hypothetical protein CEXT_766751, partial [Caerostris extrusa]